MALNLVGLLAGDTGRQWFDKFNAALTAIMQGSTARDASDAQLQSQITALSNRLNTVSAAIYSPPPGAYAASPVGGPQLYSAKAALYGTGGTLAGRVAVSSSTQTAASYGDAWTPTADFSIVVEQGSPNNLVFRRLTRNAAGAVTVNSSVNLSSSSANYNWVILSASVQSATQVLVKFYFQYSSTLYSATVTWDGNASMSVTSLNRTVTGNVIPSNPSNNRRGYLVGSASVLDYGSNGVGTTGTLNDRAMTVALATVGNFVAPSAAAAQISQDYPGGGYVVRFGASTVPNDNVARPTVWLELWDDAGCQVLQKLRIAGKTLATVVSCVVLNGIAIVQWLDSSSTRYTAVVAFNLATNALTLYGPYISGNLGSQSFGYPIVFDGLDCYFLRLATASTGACKLMLASFNPGGAVGSELTSVTASDLALTLATSSANGVAALVGVTSVSIVNVWLGAQDVLCVMYLIATSGTGASTPGFYVDTFNLA